MLNFYVRHGMVDDEVNEIFSFRQSKWLENYINFQILRKINDFEKSSMNYSITHFLEGHWKIFEMV